MQTTAQGSHSELNRWLIVFFTIVVAALSLVFAHSYESSHPAQSPSAVASVVSGDTGAVPGGAIAADDTPGGSGPLGDLLGMGCVLAILVGIAVAATRTPGVRPSSVGEHTLGVIRAWLGTARTATGPSLIALAVSRR